MINIRKNIKNSVYLLIIYSSLNLFKIGNSAELPDLSKIWDYNNPDKTEIEFRRLLPIAENSDNSYYLELLTQIARTQGLQMKFNEAHETLDEVEKQLNNNFKIPKIRYFLERGRVYNSSKQKEKSLTYFKDALNLSLKTKQYYYAVDAAHMLGIADKLENQIMWNEKAIEIAETSNDSKAKAWLGSLYNNTGWTYHDKGEYQKALNYFTKNVTWHKEKNSIEGLLIAKWCVARTLRSLGKIDEALEMQYNLLEDRKEKNLEHNAGYVYEEIGENLLLQNKKDESKKYFSRAYEILSQDKWLKKYEKDRLERISNLSK